MIRDLSETLGAMLDDDRALRAANFFELADAHILFERPDENFSPGALSAVNLFLYDVREDLQLRSNEPIITRNNGQALIQRAPLRVACSYLVTAWPVLGADLALQEHRLLSQVLQVLSASPRIDDKYIKPESKLKGQEPPLPMITAQTDGLKNPHEFWTAIGNKLRPSITVTATISMPVFAATAAPIVISEKVALAQLGLPATREEFFRINGIVTNAVNEPVANATVTLLDRGLATKTGDDGRYTFTMLAPSGPGEDRLQVQFGTTTRNFVITVPAPAGKNYNVLIA